MREILKISLVFIFLNLCFAQEILEFNLDLEAKTIDLPKIFKPSIDLSGGVPSKDRPFGLASLNTINFWKEQIGFQGVYRLIYNLWELESPNLSEEERKALLESYETLIREINSQGGIVILALYGVPLDLAKIKDKRSPPRNLHAYKELVKKHIRYLSCQKHYPIWYEVWNTADLEEFFLGKKQDYFSIYKEVATAVKELREETKIFIPLGGPAVSWWFQNFSGNTIFKPQRSLIYELIKFCANQKLPLDFISWHGFSSDAEAEKSFTIYKNYIADLIREWLGYFGFEKDTPLVITEWNYDRAQNILPERDEDSYICASFIISRLKNMHEAKIDLQTFFSLEDFFVSDEGIIRNTGVFRASKESTQPKIILNTFKALSMLGDKFYQDSLKLKDEFIGLLATKKRDGFAVLVYNYIDPDYLLNFFSRNIALLNTQEQKFILECIQSEELEKAVLQQIAPSPGILGYFWKAFTFPLRFFFPENTSDLRALFEKAKGLIEKAEFYKKNPRRVRINFKNLPAGSYVFQIYEIKKGSSLDFLPVEEKEEVIEKNYTEIFNLEPYSVLLLILEKKA